MSKLEKAAAGTKQTKITGVVANLPTTFSPDGSVDHAALESLVDFCITSGVNGLSCLLSSGHFTYLSSAERHDVIKTVLHAAAGRVPVVAGITAQWTDETLRLAGDAFELGVSGALLLPLSYWPLRPDEALAHYKKVVTSMDGQWGIYNNPRIVGIDLTAPMYKEICSYGNVTFTKDSSADPFRGRDVNALLGDRFQYLCGTEIQFFHSLLDGAAGACVAIASVLPAHIANLMRLVQEGKLADAQKLYERLLPVMRFFQKYSVPRAVRLLSELLGRPLGNPRAPLLPLGGAEVRAELEAVIAKCDLRSR